MSKAASCCKLGKVLAAEGRTVHKAKGPSGGSANIAFYAAYGYCEKVRLRDSKPKSQMRQEMERAWGEHGMTLPEEERRGQ